MFKILALEYVTIDSNSHAGGFWYVETVQNNQVNTIILLVMTVKFMLFDQASIYYKNYFANSFLSVQTIFLLRRVMLLLM